jgi:hypothetical protein
MEGEGARAFHEKGTRMNRILLAVLLLLTGPAACQNGGKGGELDLQSFALENSEGSPVTLSGQDEWKRMNPSGPFLISPRWLSGEAGIVAFGWKGRGLYRISPDEGRLDILGLSLRPPLVRLDGESSFCLRSTAGSEVFEYDAGSGSFKSTSIAGKTCDFPSGKEDWDRIIFDGPDMKVIHDLYRGALKILIGGTETTIEAFGSWGATVSPDESMIAYCTGPLGDARIFIYHREKGKIEVGRGVHPSWFPRDPFLVYAVAEAEAAQGQVVRSDLFLYDVEQSQAYRLTRTTDIVEMQPSLSPSGDSLVFADWKSGVLLTAAVEREAEK